MSRCSNRHSKEARWDLQNALSFTADNDEECIYQQQEDRWLAEEKIIEDRQVYFSSPCDCGHNFFKRLRYEDDSSEWGLSWTDRYGNCMSTGWYDWHTFAAPPNGRWIKETYCHCPEELTEEDALSSDRRRCAKEALLNRTNLIPVLVQVVLNLLGDDLLDFVRVRCREYSSYFQNFGVEHSFWEDWYENCCCSVCPSWEDPRGISDKHLKDLADFTLGDAVYARPQFPEHLDKVRYILIDWHKTQSSSLRRSWKPRLLEVFCINGPLFDGTMTMEVFWVL